MKRSMILSTAGVCCAAMALAACSSSGSTGAASASTGSPKATASVSSGSTGSAGGKLTSLKLITFPANYYFTDNVAQDKGFFKQHGLDVQFIKPSNGVSATQLIISGSVQGAISDGPLAVLTASKGQDLKIIGSVFNRNPWVIYLSTKDKGVGPAHKFPQSLQALKGKTIGVTGIGAGTDVSLTAALTAAHIDPKSVTHLGIGLNQAAIGQFINGRIDAYVGAPPAGAQFAEKKLATSFFSMADDAPPAFADIAQGTMIFNTSWVDSHKAAAQAYVSAEEEAAKWVANPANSTAAIAECVKAYGITSNDCKTFVSQTGKVYAQNLPHLAVSKKLWQNNIGLLESTGLLKKADAPSYTKYVASFAQAG